MIAFTVLSALFVAASAGYAPITSYGPAVYGNNLVGPSPGYYSSIGYGQSAGYVANAPVQGVHYTTGYAAAPASVHYSTGVASIASAPVQGVHYTTGYAAAPAVATRQFVASAPVSRIVASAPVARVAAPVQAIRTVAVESKTPRLTQYSTEINHDVVPSVQKQVVAAAPAVVAAPVNKIVSYAQPAVYTNQIAAAPALYAKQIHAGPAFYTNQVHHAQPALYSNQVAAAPALYTSQIHHQPAFYTNQVHHAQPALYSNQIVGQSYAVPASYSWAQPATVGTVGNIQTSYASPLTLSSTLPANKLIKNIY